MSSNYENGVVSNSAGGSTDIAVDFETTGDIYWVDSASGDDANAGTNRNEPKATLGSAITAATANNGDMIIIESGHTETLASSLQITKAGIRIYGLGSGSNKPSFTVDAAVDGIDITTGGYVEIDGLRFPAGTTSGNTARINLDAVGILIKDCDFLCGENDLNTITVTANAIDCKVEGGSMTIEANGADSGILVESASALGFVVDGMSFDGGDFNFDNGAIYSTVAHTEFTYRDVSLTNNAHIIHTAAAKGLAIGTVMGDGSRLEI